MSVLKQFEHLRIRLEVIESATNNFDKDCCIGRGGFGNVYKGELLHPNGHTIVACKRLDRAFGQGDSEFWKEVIMLSVYRHQNIVSLLGFCDEKDEKILLYEYLSKRSLDLHLDNKDLTWVRRLTVCIGAARGLAYLHDPGETQQRVLHRDIKSSNILLDENWNARIADLGLSRYGPANQKYTFLVTNNTVGTIGYCDPVYLESGILTKESDVYSFGVVLFEVLCGRLCFGYSGSFTQMVRKHYKQNSLSQIIWGNIKDEIHPISLKAFSTIAYRCLKSDNEKRPLMNDIVTGLETALQYQLSTASMSMQTSQPGFEKLNPDKVDFQEYLRHNDQNKWLKTRGVGEENLVQNLPKDPRRDMKRHICVDLVKRVPLFKNMNERLLDDICQRLKPRLYTNNSYIIREGDPVDEMLFITRGRLESATTDRFFINSGFLKEGDFFGDELLIWAFKPEYGTNLPSSTRTLKALRDVEAFALQDDELKFVAIHFKGIPSRQVHHTFQYYSKGCRSWAVRVIQAAWRTYYKTKQWQTWAACSIQAAWRAYYQRKIFLEQREEEEAQLAALDNEGGGIRASYRLRNRKILMKLRKSPFSKSTYDSDYKLVLRTFRFYSQGGRVWAARFIQAAWRAYYKRKIFLEQGVEEAELTTHNNAGGGHRTSYSLRNRKILMKLRKSPYSKFSDDSDYKVVLRAFRFYSQEVQTWAACVIKEAWCRYYTRKIFLEQRVEEAELTTHNNASDGHRTSYNLRNQKILMKLRKFPYSKFSDDSDYPFRFYSQEGQTWAACVIQEAWRRYYMSKKIDRTSYCFGDTSWALLELELETDKSSMQKKID